MDDLARLIQERMDALGIRSGRELAKRTEASPDGALNQATIAKYRRTGTRHQVPDERTLRSLAHALQVPVQRLREAAGLPPGQLGPFALPPEADYLDEKERAAVLAVVRAFLDRHTPSDKPPLRMVDATLELDEPSQAPPEQSPESKEHDPASGRTAP